MPTAEGAGTLTALTPQVPPPPPSEMADVVGALKYDLNRKIFEAELGSLRSCVGTGTLHSSYERIQGTARHGGRDFLFNIAHAVCCGEVHQDLGVELTHLRALCVYKPDGSHRPLGLPECETRFFLGCLAAQERPSWSEFYTSPLPAVAAAQVRDIERAQECLAQAEAASTQARGALASAERAQDVALQAEGLGPTVAAQERVLAAEAELQSRGAVAAEASAGLAQAKAPRNHPVNLAFSPGGSTALAQLVDTWHEAEPYNHTLPDDVENMYNNVSLRAAFHGMREHQPHLIPATRLIYGQPAPIWLERTTGPLRAASVYIDEETAEGLDHELGAGAWETGACATGADYLRACKGGHQGCPIATNLCCLPYFLALCQVQEKFPTVRIAGFADDTYSNGKADVLYAAYAEKRRICLGPAAPGEPPACEVRSNLAKVSATSPSGSVADIPDGLGDGIKWANGFECVGIFKGDDAWVQAKCKEKLLKRLAPLDEIERLQDDERNNEVARLQKILYTDCGALQGVYVAQAQRPTLSGPGLEAARDRLRIAWERLTGADASPEGRRELAWLQARCQTSMGGAGVYDAYEQRGACYAASYIKNWPLLQRISPALRNVDFATSNLPSLAAARDEYETLRTERDRIAAVHAAYDAFQYHTIDGDKLPRFRPKSLTPAARLPEPARLYTPDTNDSIPTPPSQKALSSVVNHGRWLKLIDAAHEFDRTAVDTKISHREATRIVSASQFGAGMWLEACPDASVTYARANSGVYVVALQRRLGLYISSARATNDAILAAGGEPDYLGDLACNAGEHSTRHHAANRAWRSALAAVAIGEVILGDKEKAGEYKKYNDGYVPDIVQPGASAWGTDWIGETKVPSPLGAAPAKDQCERVGHLVAFGNTEEWLHRAILGCRARGLPPPGAAPAGRLPPFDHKTGEGHVPFHGGDYYDARYNKRNQVVPLIVEALGGIGRRGARCLRFLARRASCRKRGRDGTKYSRFHPTNYLSHHLAGIVTAAVFADAAHIVEEIVLLKTRATAAAAADPTE